MSDTGTVSSLPVRCGSIERCVLLLGSACTSRPSDTWCILRSTAPRFFRDMILDPQLVYRLTR